VLRRETLPGRILYRAVPALSPNAFLTAVTRSPDDYPLLSGRMRVFTAGAYLGSYALEEAAPESDLVLPFGIDNRIKVERLPLPRKQSREGYSGKYSQVSSRFRTSIQNTRDQAVTLVLEDRIPVAEDERIEVRLGKETTPGFRNSERRPGVMLWDIELAAGEKRELVLEYSVRHPRELTLSRLD